MDRALKKRALQDEVLQLRQQLKENYSFHNIISQEPGDARHLRADPPHRRDQEHGPDRGGDRHRQGADRQGGPLFERGPARGTWSRSTARPCPRACWRASCSATSGGRSPRPTPAARGGSSWPTRGRSSSTRSATSRRRCRPSSSASSRRSGSSGSAATRASRSTSGSSRRRTRAWRRRSRRASSARTCIYRLNVIKIDLPPLRDRPEDIPLLITHFLNKYARPERAAQEGLARGDGAAARLPVAGQHPRAGERHRARRRDHRRRHDQRRQPPAPRHRRRRPRSSPGSRST